MKRILLLDHPQYTSATFYLWHGLKELEALFPDRLLVSSYPYIPTNYDEPKFNYAELPWFKELSEFIERTKSGGALPYGIPPFQKDEYVTALNETVISRPFSWCTFPKRDAIQSEDQAVRELKDNKFDLIILGNSHRVPTMMLAKLKERVQNLPPVVYLDAGERDELNEHWIHVFRPVLTFKQILTPAVKEKGLTVKIPGLTFKIYPLPLSSPIVDHDISIEGLPIQWLRLKSKEAFKFLQVFYSMSNTWPERADIVRAMNEYVLKNNLDRVTGCGYQAYHYVLAHTRLAVTMRGSGRDTTRYWEIPLYKTAMVADGTMGCIHPYPFEAEKTAFFYRSIPELIEIVRRTVNTAGDVERIALAGMEHLARYHSTAARAVFFLDILNHELAFFDEGLKEVLDRWKSGRKWDGRPWEGPVV